MRRERTPAVTTIFFGGGGNSDCMTTSSDSAVEVGSPYTVSLDTADPRGLPPPGEEAPGPSPLPLLLVGLCSFDPAAGVPEELLRGEGGRPDQRKVKGLWTSQVDPRLLRPGNNRYTHRRGGTE